MIVTSVFKIDIRLAPMLAILYLISNLDRTNIGNANIEGLSEDLGLTGVQYNTALSILFVTYVGFGMFVSFTYDSWGCPI
jgi:hypothetical protein